MTLLEQAKVLPGTNIEIEWNDSYPHAQQRVLMAPLQYLELVIPPLFGPKEAPFGFSKYSVAGIEKGITRGEKFWSLRLDVDVDERAVTGHEGRHRAYWAWKKGIDRVPVVIWHERDKHPVAVTEKFDVLDLMAETVYKNRKYPGPIARTADGKDIYADRTAKDVALGHTTLIYSNKFGNLSSNPARVLFKEEEARKEFEKAKVIIKRRYPEFRPFVDEPSLKFSSSFEEWEAQWHYDPPEILLNIYQINKYLEKQTENPAMPKFDVETTLIHELYEYCYSRKYNPEQKIEQLVVAHELAARLEESLRAEKGLKPFHPSSNPARAMTELTPPQPPLSTRKEVIRLIEEGKPNEAAEILHKFYGTSEPLKVFTPRQALTSMYPCVDRALPTWSYAFSFTEWEKLRTEFPSAYEKFWKRYGPEGLDLIDTVRGIRVGWYIALDEKGCPDVILVSEEFIRHPAVIVHEFRHLLHHHLKLPRFPDEAKRVTLPETWDKWTRDFLTGAWEKMSYQDTEIDPKILPLVKVLNQKGYRTISSCEGHLDKETKLWSRANVVFYADYTKIAKLREILSDLIARGQINEIKESDQNRYTIIVEADSRQRTDELLTEIVTRLMGKSSSSPGSNPAGPVIPYLAVPVAFGVVLVVVSFVGWIASKLESSNIEQ